MKLYNTYLFSFLILMGVLLPLSRATADPLKSGRTEYGDSTKWGGEVPFPWGGEIPFPWRQIEGVWSVAGTTGETSFQFKVAQENNGIRVVRVIEMHGSEVMATGVGVSGVGNRILRAVMNTGGEGYLLFVRAFKDQKLCQEGKTVVVITVKALGVASQGRHHIIQKQSDKPICSEE